MRTDHPLSDALIAEPAITHCISIARPELPDTRVIYNINGPTVGNIRNLVNDLEKKAMSRSGGMVEDTSATKVSLLTDLHPETEHFLEWLREQTVTREI